MRIILKTQPMLKRFLSSMSSLFLCSSQSFTSDAAILAFLSTFVGIVARNDVDATLKSLFEQLPKSIKTARKVIDGNLKSVFVAHLALVLTPGNTTHQKLPTTVSFPIILNTGIGKHVDSK